MSSAGAWPERAARTTSRGELRVYADQADTLAELIERSIARHATRTAVREIGGRTITYAALGDETERVAGALQRIHGVEPGDEVAFLSPNRLDLLVGVLAAWRAGAVAVMLNARFTPAELAQQLSLCSPRVVLAHPGWMDRIAGPVWPLGSPDAGRFEPPAIGTRDPALAQFTSGTTGVPKKVVQSHLNLVTAAETWIRCLGLEPTETTVVAAPMYHATGLNGQSLPVLAVGGSVAILPSFDAAALVDELGSGAASFFHAAPTIYTLAMRAAGGRRARRLRISVAGGAFVGRMLVSDARRFAPGTEFRISYGMTETSSPAVLTPPGRIDDRPGDAVGMAVPVDDVAVDDTGEILFRGATVITGDRWLRSGDVGTLDSDGFVAVRDRIKDIINRGGEKVASLEIEDALASHPGVVEAAVVATPDDVYGEVPRAFVVGDVDADTLRAFASTRLARYKVPVEFVALAELPRNGAGKVLKADLREYPSGFRTGSDRS